MLVWLKKAAPLVLAAIIAGCAQDSTVSALFETTVTVSAGDDVYYEDEIVGEVEKVVKEDRGSRVYVSLSSGVLEGLRKGSAATMVASNGQPALEVYNRRDRNKSLNGGDELVALNNTLEYVAWQAGETAGFAQTSLTDMTSSLKHYLDGEEWARQKEDMEQSLAQLGVDAKEAMAQMEEDYDALVEELGAQSAEHREQVQKRYEDLSANVQQQLAILLKNGEDAVAAPLRQLSRALDRLMKRYSAAEPNNS